MTVRLKHPETGVEVTVSADVASRLGWPKVSARKSGQNEPEQEKGSKG